MHSLFALTREVSSRIVYQDLSIPVQVFPFLVVINFCNFCNQFCPRIIPYGLFSPFYPQIGEIMIKISKARLSEGWI